MTRGARVLMKTTRYGIVRRRYNKIRRGPVGEALNGFRRDTVRRKAGEETG